LRESIFPIQMKTIAMVGETPANLCAALFSWAKINSLTGAAALVPNRQLIKTVRAN
jgi:hypothetical protein